VRRAYESVIAGLPAVAAELDDLASKQAVPDWSVDVKSLLHKHGTNLRFLGQLRQLAARQPAKELLLAHAVARTARRLIQAELRRGDDQHSIPGNEATASMLNRLAGFEELMTVPFCVEVHACFSGAFSDSEWATPPPMSEGCRGCALRIFKSLVGVPAAIQPTRVLLAADVPTLLPVIKMMTIPRTTHIDIQDVNAVDAMVKRLEDEVAVREELLGPYHRQVLSAVNHLSMMHFTITGGTAASDQDGNVSNNLVTILRKQLAVAEHCCGTSSAEYTTTMVNLSEVLQRNGRLQEAAELMESTSGPDDPNLMRQRAQLLQKQGKADEAVALLERALEQCEATSKQNGNDHGHYSTDLQVVTMQVSLGRTLCQVAGAKATSSGDLQHVSEQSSPGVERGLQLLWSAELGAGSGGPPLRAASLMGVEPWWRTSLLQSN
jgi:hypothetical protein